MCQTCGCTPCKKCGGEIEDEVCCGCRKPSDECTCEPVDSSPSSVDTE